MINIPRLSAGIFLYIQHIHTMKQKTAAIASSALLLISNLLVAQDEYDPETDREHERNANRLINLDFTDPEIIMTIAAVALFAFAYWTAKREWRITGVLVVLGCIATLPALILVLGLAMTAVKYAFFLAVIIGGIYFLIVQINKRRDKD